MSQGTGKIPTFEFEKEKISIFSLPSKLVKKQYKINTATVKVNLIGMINVKSNCKCQDKNVQFNFGGFPNVAESVVHLMERN